MRFKTLNISVLKRFNIVFFLFFVWQIAYSQETNSYPSEDNYGINVNEKIEDISIDTYNNLVSFALDNMTESTVHSTISSSCKASFSFESDETIAVNYCTEEIYYDDDEIGQIHRNVYERKLTGQLILLSLERGCGLYSFESKGCYYNGYSGYSIKGRWQPFSPDEGGADLLINASREENTVNIYLYGDDNWVLRYEMKVADASFFLESIIYKGKRKINAIKAVAEVKNAEEIYFEGVIQHTILADGRAYIIVKVTKGKLKGDEEKTFYISTRDRDKKRIELKGSEILNYSKYNEKIPIKGKVIKALGKIENMNFGGYDIKAIYRPIVIEKL